MSDTIEIILVSDNHGRKKPIFDLKRIYPASDYFIHCGDIEMPKHMMDGYACVSGNNDYYGEYPRFLVLEIGEHRFYVTHGHRDMFYGHYEMLAAKAKSLACDVVCFGHTHVPYDQTVDGVRLLNPGSIWHNRDGSDPSYMVIRLSGSEITVEKITYIDK